MGLISVVSVMLRPDKTSMYETQVQRLAEKAKAGRESFEWAAREEAAGGRETMHFITQAADWATMAEREPLPIFVRRVMGDKDGSQFMEQVGQCIVTRRHTIGRERPDLSQPPEAGTEHGPLSMVTLMSVRAGGEDACEELIRKVAQAIPKVKDPRRFITYQTILGNTRVFWTATPLADLADLDRIRSPKDLLHEAYGADGASIYRSGLEAIERMQRRISVLRPELSHASWIGKVSGRWMDRGVAERPHATH